MPCVLCVYVNLFGLLVGGYISCRLTSKLSSAARDFPSPNPSIILLALLRYFLYFSISASLILRTSSILVV